MDENVAYVDLKVDCSGRFTLRFFIVNVCTYDHTIHKTTWFIILLIDFTELLSHEVINHKNRDLRSGTGCCFILRMQWQKVVALFVIQ